MKPFSLKYEMFSKSVEIEAVFTKAELNNECNTNFSQNRKCVQKVLK